MYSRKIIVTGASGLVGSALVERLKSSGGYSIVKGVRSVSAGLDQLPLEALDSNVAIRHLEAADVVVHCGARVHVMNDRAVDPLDEFRKANVQGTLELARRAAEGGVRRFIFISSIKVNGEATIPDCPYLADQEPAPRDPYGISKMEAEEGLRALAQDTGLEVVIIRPVLVYGPGVKANFYSLMKWLSKGVPLPLGAIVNRRSLVALDNLVDLMVTCIDHPAAANQTFLVSDDEDLSTSDLLRRLGLALGRSPRLLPVPARILQLSAGLVGKKALAQRLCGSLQVDITKTRSLLGWTPVISVDEALLKTARHFQKR